MTEEQILASGYFVKLPKDGKIWMTEIGLYVLPKEANLKEGWRVCIETQLINREIKYWGKVDALRIALNNEAQFSTFLAMAWDFLGVDDVEEDFGVAVVDDVEEDFGVAVVDDVDKYWQHFLPKVQKLHEELRSSIPIAESWWRSRYSDFLTKNNTMHTSSTEFLYREVGFQIWPKLWERYKKQLTKFY